MNGVAREAFVKALHEALGRCGGAKDRAAADLGVSLRTVERYVERCNALRRWRRPSGRPASKD